MSFDVFRVVGFRVDVLLEERFEVKTDIVGGSIDMMLMHLAWLLSLTCWWEAGGMLPSCLLIRMLSITIYGFCR